MDGWLEFYARDTLNPCSSLFTLPDARRFITRPGMSVTGRQNVPDKIKKERNKLLLLPLRALWLLAIPATWKGGSLAATSAAADAKLLAQIWQIYFHTI